MRHRRFWLLGGRSFVLLCAVSAFITPTFATLVDPEYQTVTGDPQGFGLIWKDEMGYGEDYGKARVDYWYWYDSDTTYWHYAYKIYNNDYFGTSPGDLTDDYHLGWYESSNNPDSFNSIHTFAIVDIAPDNLFAFDAQTGSSAGSPDWVAGIDPGNTGVDWFNAGGAPLIQPTRWELDNKGNLKKDGYYPGQTSRDDASGHYFQIASTWGPGPCNAEVILGVGITAAGPIYGPTVVPEPATCLLFTLGTLALTLNHRRKSSEN